MSTDYSRPQNGFSSKGNGEPSKAPFAYYGAKQRLASRIVAMLPPHNAWVEGFCGSAALTLAKPAARIEIINDLNDEIVNLFCQLRNNSAKLCEAIALTPYASAEFDRCRVHKENENNLERARRFLVRTMMTINGTVDRSHRILFSPSYSRDNREARVNRWYNLPDRLATIVERLRNVA